jgi:glycosyltransferase involved in cell wall biosynthesis
VNPTVRNLHLWVPNIFEFKGGIQVYSGFLLKALEELQPYQRLKVFLKHDQAVPEELLDCHSIGFHCAGQWSAQLRTLAFASQLGFHALKQKPDLVFSTHLNFTPVARLLKKTVGIPYWTVAHGVDAWNINNPGLQKALQNADRILAVSHYTRDRLLQEQGLDPAKVMVLPNTFDVNQFSLDQKPEYLLNRHRLNSDQPVILTVARLDASERYKGYDQILRALPKILQVIPDVRYVLVGKGSDRPRVEALIQELGLENNTTLTGFIPDEEIHDYYNLCDVFALPSKGEGFGIVYLEALACGKPVIGGNKDGAIDALCHGKLGLLVDPDDVDAISNALIEVLQKQSTHTLLYRPSALRKAVEEAYGFDSFKHHLEDLFHSFASSKTR